MSKRGTKHSKPLAQDPERQKEFLDYLASGAVGPIEAARRASPHLQASRDGQPGYSVFRRLREVDPRFAAAWDQALEQGRARMIAELEELAIERIRNPSKKPVFSKGELVGWAQDLNAATKLHLRYLARLDAAWAERRSTEVTGRVEHAHAHIHAEFDPNSLVIDVTKLGLLTPERADLLIELVGELRDRVAAEAELIEEPTNLEAPSDD
ncbi:MAG: hypothetical protein AAGB48_10630 [Planctomycetota bacterium]